MRARASGMRATARRRRTRLADGRVWFQAVPCVASSESRSAAHALHTIPTTTIHSPSGTLTLSTRGHRATGRAGASRPAARPGQPRDAGPPALALAPKFVNTMIHVCCYSASSATTRPPSRRWRCAAQLVQHVHQLQVYIDIEYMLHQVAMYHRHLIEIAANIAYLLWRGAPPARIAVVTCSRRRATRRATDKYRI